MVQKTANSGLGAHGHHAPAPGFVRVGPLMHLPALMRELGSDPDPIFDDMGFSSAYFSDPNYEIPFVSGSRLLARCVTETRCEHLGLALAEKATPSTLGVVGFMLGSASDVGTALKALVQNLDLHDGGAVLTLEVNDRVTLLHYRIHLTGVKAAEQIYDLSMAIAFKIMRTLCGESWGPTEVLLSRHLPQDPARYRRFFQAPLRFDADQSTLAFSSHWLNHPITSADPLLYDHLMSEASDLHDLQKTNLITELRRLMSKSFTTQKRAVTDIAAQLGMHERTLNRRLQKEGTTFRQEFEKLRYDTAQQFLSDTMMPMSQIATVLGYTDETAFSRAFKRWSGFSPTKWRQVHNQS